MADISSANAIIMLGVTDLYNVPVQIQRFSADDIFSTEAIDIAETVMGADGKMSAGIVYNSVKWSITLQADSPSNIIFDVAYGAERAQVKKYFWNGTVVLPSTGTVWTMNNGVLKSYSPISDAKRILQPRKYTFEWESVSPSVTV